MDGYFYNNTEEALIDYDYGILLKIGFNEKFILAGGCLKARRSDFRPFKDRSLSVDKNTNGQIFRKKIDFIV